jgi:hypothetical protein
MPFSIRPYRRFPVQCSVTYNVDTFEGQDTAWNLSLSGLRLSGDLPMRSASCFLSPFIESANPPPDERSQSAGRTLTPLTKVGLCRSA